ncbi:DUF1831 domain-containing protein [Paucilactobacillus wasatchensis]|uniref:Cysteine desulfurase n=1 Tax=Paucilactobacillus wasatchensis TaxID=1335616 RepID=A0A0D0Y481_9LACO|nr:DUF1831 domain-containing protein [Paucilactobacillus wasatchensis]KIS03073.1 hypothetical protein WDC_1319 [Paucilactobacillus wasatchensis]
MAFEKRVQVIGDTDTYSISPAIKKYTLRDLGFEVSKRGSFTFERSLDPSSPYKAAAKLKIVVNDDLTGFKMNTVNASGTGTMNIFTSTRTDEFVTQYHYVLAEMIDRGVFEKN